MSADNSDLLTLYHFTSPQAARRIAATRTWACAENTGEVYASTRIEGQAKGYGTAYVRVLVLAACAVLDDEFPDGEQHYRFRPNDAVITGVTI